MRRFGRGLADDQIEDYVDQLTRRHAQNDGFTDIDVDQLLQGVAEKDREQIIAIASDRRRTLVRLKGDNAAGAAKLVEDYLVEIGLKAPSAGLSDAEVERNLARLNALQVTLGFMDVPQKHEGEAVETWIEAVYEQILEDLPAKERGRVVARARQRVREERGKPEDLR